MTSLNLLVGYGSDESDTSETTENIELPLPEESATTKKTNFFQIVDDSSSGDEDQTDDFSLQDKYSRNLKNPFRSSEPTVTKHSVFTNPYKEAEDAEKGTLEKHVKFAPKLEDVKEINGRKVCWNYRKGRCRFGSNCVFAHDSELLQKKQKQVDPLENSICSPDFDDSTGNPTISQNSRCSTKRHSGDQMGNPSEKKVRLHQHH
ncbi:uncharacterized protein LOC130691166 [Daphnia carinata]|uniref:uncharacterized protein LOC130691166 n=1 Tax=Daphnia carinata TaxID=120202 RepID=UPI00257CD71B|nr:uncharacterized protein LOC130691166 [Daphnia carinata]